MSSPSASRVSSSLNWLPSSPRSNSNVQPGYLKSGSPPGASITPSSDTNSVTTISAGTWVSSARSLRLRAVRPRRARELIAEDLLDARLLGDDLLLGRRLLDDLLLGRRLLEHVVGRRALHIGEVRVGGVAHGVVLPERALALPP